MNEDEEDELPDYKQWKEDDPQGFLIFQYKCWLASQDFDHRD